MISNLEGGPADTSSGSILRMARAAFRSYGVLCGALGIGMVLAGLAFFAAFFAYHAPASDLAIPTGPTGFYFVAFTGCALVGWGGSLLAVARQPAMGRAVGTATAVALVMSASYRMLAWLVGDYHAWLGNLPRVEAAVMLILALAFLWLRPPVVSAEAG